MRTKSAADAAAAEAASWIKLSADWSPDRRAEIWSIRSASERSVIPQVDPRADLERRARRWSYPLGDGDLADLARLAAALARTEAEMWAAGDGVVATQAYEERRFLAGDRIVPWAVPWLRAVAEHYSNLRRETDASISILLETGELHRLAPVLTGEEGLNAPGHDGYGPADAPAGLADRLNSLWGGLVVFQPQSADDPVARYAVAADEWRSLANRYPGTARYWFDLARRAELTAEIAK